MQAPCAPTAPTAPCAPAFTERSVAFSFASSLASAKLKKADVKDKAAAKGSESFTISASDLLNVKLRSRAASDAAAPAAPAAAGAGGSGALVTLDQLRAVQLRKRTRTPPKSKPVSTHLTSLHHSLSLVHSRVLLCPVLERGTEWAV